MGSVDTSMALLMNPRYTVDWACNHTNPSHGRTVPFRGLQPRSDEVDLRGSILRNTNTRLRTPLTLHSTVAHRLFLLPSSIHESPLHLPLPRQKAISYHAAFQ